MATVSREPYPEQYFRDLVTAMVRRPTVVPRSSGVSIAHAVAEVQRARTSHASRAPS